MAARWDADFGHAMPTGAACAAGDAYSFDPAPAPTFWHAAVLGLGLSAPLWAVLGWCAHLFALWLG